MTAPILLIVFPVVAALEPAAKSTFLLFAPLFGLLFIAAWYAIAREDGTVHLLAAFFALAAEAVWSAKYLSAGNLLPALGWYAAFGLFYLGVPILARACSKRLELKGGGAVVLFLSLGLLFFLASGAVASTALWGIALLLLILNFGLLLEATAGRPAFLFVGLVMSWLVIAKWWTTVSIETLLIPGLAVVGGFAIMALAANIWAAQRASAAGAPTPQALQQGLYLSLAGHAFLLFVVLQRDLAVPPWPFLGVLFVLNFAIGVAALYSRRGTMQLAALAASQIILTVWQYTVQSAPWPQLAVICAIGIAGMGFIWFLLSRKLSIPSDGSDSFAAAAVGASFAGFAVILAAESVSGIPPVALLAIASVIFIAFILAMDFLANIQWLAPAAVFPAAFVLFVWSLLHSGAEFWREQLFYAGASYAVFLAYPLALGDRARARLGPYLAAVMSSGIFFLFARPSLIAGGWKSEIGLLPIAQALLMAWLLKNLLRIEPSGERRTGRLAMVAGAILAFITVAIPLQLDKEWITIGWALLAAALSWLWLRIPHKGLAIWSGGLLSAVFLRLVLNPEVFSYHPRASVPILNWYLYTYVVCAAAFFAAGYFMRKRQSPTFQGLSSIPGLAAAGGAVLLFVVLNIEIADYYSKGTELAFNFNAELGQDLTYTIGWGIFAFGLLIAGIILHNKASRVSAIALLSVTIAKCFLHDLWRLGGLYRIGSFAGLAICLTLVALLLQKFVLMPQSETE